MKIITKIGNLLASVHEGHMVHGCNAQGVMGSGYARSLKEMYPGAFAAYRQDYEDEGLELGTAYPYMPSNKLVIWNAITQEYYGKPGRNCSYDAIETCFTDINTAILSFDEVVKEIHIPMIGCGLANGSWNIVSAIIEDTCTVPVTLWILPT